MDIDFILPYLDSSNSTWQQLYAQYTDTEEGDNPARFRDWGWLRFWLRSVERYAPWVRRIYIIANHPAPKWLNLGHEKIVWLDHKDYIPAEFLPTFNANTIELNLHRIQGLSEHFVYFNDDTLLNAPVSPEYYFRDGLPIDATAEALFFSPHCENGNWGSQLIEYCNVGILRRHFLRRDVVRGQRQRWYGGYLPWSARLKAFLLSFQSQFFNFNTPHHEKPLLKSVFEEVWAAEPDYLRRSCTRFREDTNVNVYLMRLWHLATNRFYPDRYRLSGHYYEILPESLDAICDEILHGTTPSVCFNDVPQCSEAFYQEAKVRILAAFETKYPNPFSFELGI